MKPRVYLVVYMRCHLIAPSALPIEPTTMQHDLLDFELLHNRHTFLSWLQEDG